ncbi:hypothetical protein [Vibrio chagasii]|uniref:hypothetical protein n=1 Tax=Vibrio chagasii TaxID=170679 RepID=UPI003DA17D4A
MGLNKAIKYREDLHVARTAKNKAFSFVPAEHQWQLDIKWSVDLAIIHDASISKEQKEDFLTLLVFRAENSSKITFEHTFWAMKSMLRSESDSFTPESIDSAFQNHCPKSYRLPLLDSLKVFIEYGGIFQSQAFNVFYLNRCADHKQIALKSRHLDPNKGAHTPTEFDSVMEGMRLLTQKMHNTLDTERPFFRRGETGSFGLLIGGMMWVLMMSLLRRPIQLMQIKMVDFRTNQGDFKAVFSNSNILMDHDELKLLTFRSKKQLPPRTDYDTDLHLLNRHTSQLLMKYCSKLFQEQIIRLEEKGIMLTTKEKKALFKCYPLFPSYDDLLCASKFKDKKDVFNYINTATIAGHINVKNFDTFSVRYIFPIIEPVYYSERTSKSKKPTGNNRIRHTVLTSMAREGVDRNTLAAITGVSVSTVQCYVDMTPEERLWIDNTLGENAALSSFGRVRIQDRIHEGDDLAYNDYGDVFGMHEQSSQCIGCKEIIPVPLACYGCCNFKAFIDADHRSELNKAMKRYDFNNKNGQSERSMLRLVKAIEYINITIIKCDQLRIKELDDHAK